MDSFYGRRVCSWSSPTWSPGDSTAGCFVPEERDGSKRVLSQSRNGVEHAGPASEEAVWCAAVEWEQHGRGEPADSGGTGRNADFCVYWEAAQSAYGVVVQRPKSGSWQRFRCADSGGVGERVGEVVAMFGFGPATRIYLAPGVTDMRKNFNGLYGLVRDHLGCDPESGHVFLFANARRNR